MPMIDRSIDPIESPLIGAIDASRQSDMFEQKV
jgi:hypothetical protein